MKFRVTKPLLTNVLGEKLHQESQVPKPTAKGTPLRYSSAHSCERQQSYAALNAEPTEPVDFAGAWVMGMGTIVHEALQAAIAEKYPSAEFEVASSDPTGNISGSCDALITADTMGPDWKFGNLLFELKTMGTYSFDKQIGLNRMRGTIANPEGPALKAITQAGMNALGIEAERGITIDAIVMGSITFEAVSKQKADKLGMENRDRVMAEFWVSRSEWEPLAQAELHRMSVLASSLTEGFLGERVAIGDAGERKNLSPAGDDWNCMYCQFRTVCLQDGPGAIWVNDSSLTVRGNNE